MSNCKLSNNVDCLKLEIFFLSAISIYYVVYYVTDMVQLGVFSPSIESIHQPFQRQSIVNYAIVH